MLAVAPILEDILLSPAAAHTHLVLVPSTADANAQPVFPQWPIPAGLLAAFAEPVRRVRYMIG
jgi:hypothetical protein